MPVFEYRCPRCGRVFEHLWRGLERREELRCPDCGADKVEKVFSLFGMGGSRTTAAPSAGCAPSG